MDVDPAAQLEVLKRRYERERRARLEAETIAERVTSELYKAVQELGRANGEVESANQALREFVAVASHDLRGPLTSILGFTNVLIERGEQLDDDRRAEFLGTIQAQGGRLERLIGDLLTISRIEAGAMEAHLEELRLATELERTVDQLGESASSVLVDAPSDIVVVADPDLVRRIMENYISNAIKYGEPPIHAEVSEMDGFGEFKVRDHGDGVPDEFVQRLFGKFARLDTSATKGKQGTGLGLSIVRGLARAMGGDAWYEPNSPRGSVFAVKLPKSHPAA